MESTERAISSADRLVVPLKSMCSMKCVIPFCSGDSRREPVPTQTPTETERTCGMTSVITRTPLERVVNSISRTLVAEAGKVDKRKEYLFILYHFQGISATRRGCLTESGNSGSRLGLHGGADPGSAADALLGLGE